MQILTVISSLDPATGGPARSVPHLCKEINVAGQRINVFLDKGNENYKDSNLRTRPISQLVSVVQEAKEKKIDTIIHNHGVWLPINHTAASTARRHKIPYIVSPRGMLEPWALNFNKWKKKIAWLLYQYKDLQTAKVLHATATEEANNLRSMGLDTPIAVIPNGVHIPKQSTLRPIRKKTKNILFLSRIHPKKGLLNLVQAWAKITPAGWKVTIVGPNESEHQQVVEKEIKHLGLGNYFSFLGPVSDSEKWQLYNDADLFVLPTFSENFGIVIAEALASGTPVITTKGTPWSELVQHNCGWWVDIGVEPLRQAIIEATSLSFETRFAMGQRGRVLIEKKYSWSTIAEDMISVYEWMLYGGSKPKCIVQTE